jgi:chaperonin GroEL
MAETVKFGEEARRLLLEGASIVAQAVGCTMGPKGRTVLIKKNGAPPILTKDGVTVCRSISLADEGLNLGACLLQETATKTNDVAGDGTTTATVLIQSMMINSHKFMTAGSDPTTMKRGFLTASRAIDAELVKLSQPVKDFEDVKNVATISANGDSHIGEIVANALEKVTKDGVITLEDNLGGETNVSLVEGMKFECGYLSPYFVNDRNKMIATYDNVRIFVSDEKLTDINEFIPLLENIAKTSSKLLIIAQDVEGTAMQGLILNRTKGNLNVIAVKAPGYGEAMTEMLGDICTLTGAKMISSRSGISLKSAKLSDLGTCRRVIVGKSSTSIIGDGSTAAEIDKRANELTFRLEDVTLDAKMINYLRTRIANLSNGVAVINIGGTTELELLEKKHRIEDALNAARAAMEQGVLPGGGAALIHCARTVKQAGVFFDDARSFDGSFDAGVRVALLASEAPLATMLKNASISHDYVMKSFPDATSHGFNIVTNEFVEMVKVGIMDPTKVTRSAWMNASSIAEAFMSLDALIFTNKKEEKDEI